MATITKAKLVIYAPDLKKSKTLTDKNDFTFKFNPESVRVTKTVKPKEQKEQNKDSPELQFTSGDSKKIEFGEILLNTFDIRKSVYTEVSNLERLVTVDSDLHHPPRVLFVWGDAFGTGEGEVNGGLFVVTSLDVNYTMFLPNGTPVRAKCKVTLQEAQPDKGDSPGDYRNSPRNSPDTAHVHLVQRGDSLQAIAHSEYSDAGEWRRIAAANGIDNPLELRPGQRLLIPPILK
jgi:LysM repeat protein